MEKTDPTTATKAISIVSSCASSSWLVARHRIHRTTGSDYSETQSAQKDLLPKIILMITIFYFSFSRCVQVEANGIPILEYPETDIRLLKTMK